MNNFKGFTLTEMVIVLAVISILLSIGIPGFHDWVLNQRVNNSANEIASVFQLARLKAVKNRAGVVVEFKEGTGASAYVRAFIDDGGGEIEKAGNKIWDNGEDILSDISLDKGVSMTKVSFAGKMPSDSTATDITCFDSLGLTTAYNGSLIVKNSIGRVKHLILNSVGNARVENDE